jgi:predicted PurR-regulated permease PerM
VIAPAHGGIELTRTPLLRFLLKLPLKKLTIWAGFLGLLLILGDFFPLILMTFILSYIATSVVDRIETRFSARWIPIVLFFALVVTGVVGFMILLVPQIQLEARKIRDEVKAHRGWNKWLDDNLRGALGTARYDSLNDQWGEYLPTREIAQTTSSATAAAPPEPRPASEPLDSGGIAHVHSPSLSAGLIGHVSADDRAKVLGLLGTLISGVWKGVVYVFLSIIFSLMLVWGLPDFRGGLDRLRASRLRDVYLEVGPSIAQFGRLLGRAFEAQTIIAACNTVITFAGMQLLGIPGSFLLSVIVFVCSFIPVAGVWISTAPIAFTGLLMPEGGFRIFAGVVVMVTIAHLIEAYVLNPRIYGHHMKMNPLAVLVILIIAEHTVGLWGLVVAIPLATYIWRNVILGEEDPDAPQAPRPKTIKRTKTGITPVASEH